MERIKIRDGSVWPDPSGRELIDLGWRLRYAQKALTRGDLFSCAQVLEAYCHLLVVLSADDSMEKLRSIRAAVKRKEEE
jgi:hypothetical protein